MTNFTPDDHLYMAQALRLAEQGLYTTMPNPRVGCIIVKNNKVLGEGAHLKAGTPHAEIHALAQAGEQAAGATAYVTLEPCSHHGKTPPCTEALINADVAKVVVAMEDPNPLVAGKGIAALQAAGIAVNSGLMQQQAQALNPGFISRMVNRRPYVRSKIAASLDGKTALANGVSQWITGASARTDVQHWRAQSCAILTGIGTILKDNPSLTVRNLPIERQPMSVIVDSDLRIPLSAKILQNPSVLIAFASDTDNKANTLAERGVSLLSIPDDDGNVCLNSLLRHLACNEVNEVMVEGGELLNGSLMRLKMIDELIIYYAPKLMGGDSKNMFAFSSLQTMEDAVPINVTDIRMFGDDIRILARCS